MKILGIETSCDDTGIAIIEIKGSKNPEFEILSDIISSQIKIHQKYGGVYPMLAKRAHEKNLPIVLKKALKEAKIEKTDSIAVTYGPGLSPCLWAGLNFAKNLAKTWDVPLVPVDHIEGHLLIALAGNENFQFSISNFQKLFPATALIVSGGHTQLVFVKDIGGYKIIGETRDDAAGEAFDKTARVLGLEFPGGPAIAREAAQCKSQTPMTNGQTIPKYNIRNTKYKIQLPRPMIHTKDYDFSFSGLKTAVLYEYQSRPEKVRASKEYIQAMAAEIQQAIIDVLVHKTVRAAKEFQVKSIILGGGVAANVELRAAIEKECARLSLAPVIPPQKLATDNGVMIALVGYFNWLRGNITKDFDTLQAHPNVRIG